MGNRIKKTIPRGEYSDTWERTFWQPPGYQDPVRIEEKFRSTDPGLPDVDVVAKDFVNYAPVDREQLAFDPSSGLHRNAGEKNS